MTLRGGGEGVQDLTTLIEKNFLEVSPYQSFIKVFASNIVSLNRCLRLKVNKLTSVSDHCLVGVVNVKLVGMSMSLNLHWISVFTSL